MVADATPLAALYAVYAFMGIVETISDSAAVAVLPQAVPPDQLDRANSQIAGTQTLVDEFIGPPLGGFLFAMAAFAPSLVTVGAFLVAGTAYWRLRGSYHPVRGTAGAAAGRQVRHAQPERRMGRQIREGAAWAIHHPIVRTLIIIGGLASVGYMIPFSYLVLYAQHVLHLDAAGYGILLSVSAVGGLAGSMVAGRLRRALGYGWTTAAALLTGAGAFTVIAATTSVWLVGASPAVYMGHAVVWNILATTVRQKVVPAHMMGRVGSVGRLVGLCGMALGAGLGGVLATQLGFRAPFGIAAAFFAVAALLAMATLRSFNAWEKAEANSATGSSTVSPAAGPD